MTAISGPIVFNNSTGSDSNSGCGPSVAVTGTGASTTASSAVVTGISTTGVSVGDLLFVQSSSGRKFSVIASVDSSTQVTCDDVFANTESGRSWAIGGKRATWDDTDSRELFTNFHTSVLDKIKTETDQTLTSSITISRNDSNHLSIYADTQKTISTTGDFECFKASQNKGALFYNLKFLCGATSSKAAIAGGSFHVNSCQFGEDGSSNNWKYGLRGSNYGNRTVSHRCVFFGPGENTASSFASGGTHYNMRVNIMTECFVKDYETGYEGYPKSNICSRNVIVSCKYGATSDGGYGNNFDECANNIFHDISSDSIAIDNPHAHSFLTPLLGIGTNVFSNVSGHLITSSRTDFYQGSSTDSKTLFIYPAFPTLYAFNSSNTFNNMPTFPVQTLVADPFVDASGNDFNLNADAGGGSTLRANNFALNTDTAVYPFRHYVSDDFGSGGGNVIVIED